MAIQAMTNEALQDYVSLLLSDIREGHPTAVREAVDDLDVAAKASREALARIGDGDWTPQDSHHAALVAKVEALVIASTGWKWNGGARRQADV